jgi:hypothetical protein
MYVSAQSLDFLDLAEKCLISDLETASIHLFISGWALANFCLDLAVNFNSIYLLTNRECHEMDIKAQKASNHR